MQNLKLLPRKQASQCTYVQYSVTCQQLLACANSSMKLGNVDQVTHAPIEITTANSQ